MDVAGRLGDLLAITDTRLTQLDVDHLLYEVLGRLREILDADTAAVLLHEPGTGYLVARAARGLEEEVRQGVRVPIGTGFAGRIADTRQPVRLEQVDATTVSNPILWEKGIQRMLGVPLISGDEVLGVLHVGRLDLRGFELDDQALLQVAADRVTSALQSSRYAAEAAAADLLERGLLPTRLPRVAGVQFASRYVPSENRAIGGDWYDAFVGPDGALWLVTGDVAGHGLRAAVVMGRVKSAFRSYTLLGEGPARVLELTDRKVVHFEMGTMITVVCARSYPPFERWTVSSAGHLPPVLATPGEPSVLAAVPPGPPLGAQPGCRRRETTVPVTPGGLMVLYTDGLIERRDESLDLGLTRLQNAVRADLPEAVCRTAMHELVGASSPMDDIAMLAVRRDDPDETRPGPLVREFQPDSLAPRAARRFALQAAGPIATAIRNSLELLVSELASNAVIHAGTPFELAVTRDHASVRVEVSDKGRADVAMREPGPEDIHGRGLTIVAALADDWGVRANDSLFGKTVWFVLDLTGSRQKADSGECRP